VAVRQAALVSDESALEACACSQRCAIQIDDLYLCHKKTKMFDIITVNANTQPDLCHYMPQIRSRHTTVPYLNDYRH